MARLSVEALRELVTRGLAASGARDAMAADTAAALVDAECQGLPSHGVARALQYAAHLKNGRAGGNAQPRIIGERGGAVLVDAGHGLAYPACKFAVAEAVRRARESGVQRVCQPAASAYRMFSA